MCMEKLGSANPCQSQLRKTNRPSSFRWYGVGLHISAALTHTNISSCAWNGDVSLLQYTFCDAWLHYVKEGVPWLYPFLQYNFSERTVMFYRGRPEGCTHTKEGTMGEGQESAGRTGAKGGSGTMVVCRFLSRAAFPKTKFVRCRRAERLHSH